MKHILLTMAALAAVTASMPAEATVFTLDLTGNPANFTDGTAEFDGKHFHIFSLELGGLNADNPITVSNGDQINSTITLASAYTIPASVLRTDLLQYLTGTGFPAGNTAVSGVFNFFNGAALVGTYNYYSTTDGLLSAFAAVFPPGNGAFTFTSLTNALTIDTLGSSATIDRSAFSYALVSPGGTVPEPAAWALLIAGFGLVGTAARRRRDLPQVNA